MVPAELVAGAAADQGSGIPVSTTAAFVAAGVALIVGLLGPLVFAWTTRKTIDAQRKLANADRLWQRRSDTYIALLEWAAETRALGGEELMNEPFALRRLAEEAHMPPHLHARMTAYASGHVYAAAMQFLQGVKDALRANAELLLLATDEKVDEALVADQALNAEQSAARSDSIADKMAQLVSDDLHDVLPDDTEYARRKR